MELVYNWRSIIEKAWSFKLIVLSALLSGLEVALPLVAESLKPLELVPPGVFAGLAFIVTAAAGVARIMAQPKTLI